MAVKQLRYLRIEEANTPYDEPHVVPPAATGARRESADWAAVPVGGVLSIPL